MSADLFAPYQLDDLPLANRLVMAPMTRNRAGQDGVVPPTMAALTAWRSTQGTATSSTSSSATARTEGPTSTAAARRTACACSTRCDAVTGAGPAGRVGVRLTPENSFNSMSDSDPQAHFGYYLGRLRTRGLAYVHLIEGDMTTGSAGAVDYRTLKSQFDGTYIANNGYDLDRATSAVNTGSADLMSFGAPFLANPDLVRRYRENLPLNVPDPSTFYTGGEGGYNDYPAYTGTRAAA